MEVNFALVTLMTAISNSDTLEELIDPRMR